MSSALIPIYEALSDRLDALTFGAPVTHVYNPIRYARAIHHAYLTRFGVARGRVLFLGMNPGPWGMAQTGVPFGEIGAVRDWMGLSGEVLRPDPEHPRRPVQGLACPRAEVSGQRLWGLFRDTFGTAEAFFAEAFVANWCPLSFMEARGANRTPDKLPAAEREPLTAACDAALAKVVEALAPRLIIGVGVFAAKRAKAAIADGPPIASILHPSPASPKANRGWAEAASQELRELGVRWPFPAG